MLSLLSVGLRRHHRPCGSGCTGTVVVIVVSPAHYLLLNAPDRRVRAADARLHSLMAEGLNRSHTFASLVTALNRTDVIVYVESVMTVAEEHDGPLVDDAAAPASSATCACRFAPTCPP